jgi:hypothetical protein
VYQVSEAKGTSWDDSSDTRETNAVGGNCVTNNSNLRQPPRAGVEVHDSVNSLALPVLRSVLVYATQGKDTPSP